MKPCLLALTSATLLLSLASLTGCSLLSGAAKGADLSDSSDQHCEDVACGSSGSTMKVCTGTDSSGSCSGVSYAVGSQTFACGSCSDCEQAATQAAQACEGGGGSSGGETDGGSTSPGGGSSPVSGTMTCSAAVACGSTGTTSEECFTTDSTGTCSQITMTTSDGQSFACNGCDCTSASQQLTSYCDGSSGNGNGNGNGNGSGNGAGATTCSSAPTPCGTSGVSYQVCTTVGSNGACTEIAYETSDGQTFACNGCSDCTSAAQNITSYCSSASSEDAGSSSSGGQQCGNTVCGSAATCCTCSSQETCISLPPGEACSDLGCD